MQTKSPEKSSDFRKLYISFSKCLHFNTRTILFHASNTCVWQLKQYRFTSQTILFHPRKSNVWRMKRKNSRFHSPEGVPCQQIGSYHYAHPISLQLSLRNHYRSMNIRITPLLLNPHQSVFCESPENALGIHQPVFLCEEAHCSALRLTFCQLERLPSGDDVLHLIHYYPSYSAFWFDWNSPNWIPHNCTIPDWIGRPDRSPLRTYMPQGTLSIVNYQLSIE